MSASGSPAERRFTGLEVRTVAFCFLLNMLNGAGVVSVSYAAPLLVAEWGVAPRTLGLVFSAGLAGMTAGALLLGSLSDLLGRRTIIVAATAIVALGMAGGGLATSAGELIALRFLVGLGVGGLLAAIAAMSSEYAPPGRRSLAVIFATAGYPVGATAIALAAGKLLPAYGWSGLFFGLGALAAVLVPVCLRWMPESVEFLLARQPVNALARANRIRALAGAAPLAGLPPKGSPAAKRPSLGQVLSSEYRRDTLLLWTAFCAAFTTLYFLISWLPIVAVDAGMSVERAAHAGATYHVGSIAGHLLLGWLTSRVGLAPLVAGFFGLAAAALAVFGALHQPVALFLFEVFVIGMLAQGAFGGLYAVAAGLYPTVFRTTGIGWAAGVGRIGAVLGPLLGGVLFGLGVGLFGILLAFAIPLVVAAAATLGFSRMRGLRSETPPAIR